MSLGMSLNTFHTSQYVPLMFIQNIEKNNFFFLNPELTFFTQTKVGTYFILVSFMAHPMSFLAPFLDTFDLHLDTCITHYVVPNFHFSSIVKLLKRKEKIFWCVLAVSILVPFLSLFTLVIILHHTPIILHHWSITCLFSFHLVIFCCWHHISIGFFLICSFHPNIHNIPITCLSLKKHYCPPSHSLKVQ